MPDDSHDLPLLNVYEVTELDEERPDDPGVVRHLLAFHDTARAEVEGLDPQTIVGEVDPADDGQYDPASLKVNPDFLGAIAAYMSEVQAATPEIVAQARTQPGSWVYVIDPRNTTPPGEDPPPADLVGAFRVDDAGTLIPDSFHYHDGHALIDPDRGISGLLADQRFYDWLHALDDDPAE